MTDIADKIYAATGLTLNAEAAAKIGQMIREARRDALEEAARHFKEAAAGTPLGHENRERGASTYNWLMYCASTIRALGEKE